MLRYITFAWTASAPPQNDIAAKAVQRLQAEGEWTLGFQVPGVHVLYAGTREPSTGAWRLANGGGIVFGSLFRRAEGQNALVAPHSLSTIEADRIVASRGRDLISRYWGNYVAFLRQGRGLCVLRGPASSLPCLHMQRGDLHVFFSRMSDCAALELRSLSINWTYVARHLFGPTRTNRTGLNEITEIAPATCVAMDAESTKVSAYWDPFEIAESAPIRSPTEATAQLRETTRYCIHSWASCHENIVHNLSGGLDSSIVLACLSNAPSRPQVTCVTEHSPGADSDERTFARLAAERARCRLIEIRRDADFDLAGIFKLPKIESPSGYIRRLETTRTERRIAEEICATAAFTGEGGDELFCRHHIQYYVSDFVRANGLNLAQLGKLFGLALDAAVTEGCTIWSILRQAIRDGLFPYRRDLVSELIHQDLQDKVLLRSEVLAELSQSNEWGLVENKTTKECPPGRLWQVYLVTSRGDYYNPFGLPGDPEPVSPLLSQPLIETCLKIPTYFQREGRWERALARQAFAPDLAPQIAWRRSKGGMEEHAAEILTRNIRYIKEVLLDGLLIREGLVDRRKLEAALDSGPEAVDTGLAQIFHVLSTEAWAQTWASGPCQGASYFAAAGPDEGSSLGEFRARTSTPSHNSAP